jgi:23S rRNA pseudouridine2605 synthase
MTAMKRFSGDRSEKKGPFKRSSDSNSGKSYRKPSERSEEKGEGNRSHFRKDSSSEKPYNKGERSFAKPWKKKEDGKDSPWKPRSESSDRPNREGNSAPWKKREVSGDTPGRSKPWERKSDSDDRNIRSDSERRPYKRRDESDDKNVRSDSERRPFKRREESDDRNVRSDSERRPYKRRDESDDKNVRSDSERKPYKRREDSEDRNVRSDSERRPYKRRDESSARPWHKPEASDDRRKRDDSAPSYNRRPQSRDDKPRENSQDSGDRPYRKREESGDRPYRKREESGDRPYRKREESSDRYPKRTDSNDRPYSRNKEDNHGSFERREHSDSRSGSGREESPKREFRRPSNPDEKYKRDDSQYKPGKSRIKGDSKFSQRRTKSTENDDGLTRLNKYIANAGICSRREADEMIEAGAVTVNGKVVTELGTKVGPDDKVQIGNDTLNPQKKVYLLLNKPKGYITTVEDPQERDTVMMLVKDACRERVYPVGRLDRNTSGLLLMTNDGDLAKKLTHPSHKVRKIYQVEVNRAFNKGDMLKMTEGIELEDGLMTVDEIAYTGSGEDKKVLGVIIHSGKNRVVRRMFEALDYEVLKLDRVAFANLTKKDLPRGRWRFLEESEVNVLKML